MRRATAVAAALCALLLAAGAGPASAAESASLDWSVPERYAGTDENGDGRIDSFEPDGPLDPTPDGFRVDLAGSGADTCGAASTVWSIEGDEVAPSDPDVVGGDPRSCSFSYRFKREGTYEVTLEGRDGNGERVAEATKLVRVQDFLVVSLGDSVASGEGNPDVPGTPARWQNEQCHRSALAGPARAARALEAADPRTSVTFVHVACSGATIDEGLLGEYEGIDPGTPRRPPLPPQVEVLEEIAAEREVDVVTISIGANDVEFSGIVTDCFFFPECNSSQWPWSVAPGFEARRQALAGRYAALARRLEGLDLANERVHLSEYFDPTRDRAGEVCPGEEPGAIGILGDHPLAGTGPVLGVVAGPLVSANPALFGFAANTFQVSAEEAEWASTVMMTRLNAAVASAASDHGWGHVGGIAQRFMTHGYCASAGEHWVVRWQESMDRQGDHRGTLHPNGAGHDHYGTRIEAGVSQGIYGGGDLQSPRRPRQRLEVQGRMGGGSFLDVVDSVHAADSVTVRARVRGPDKANRDIAFTLQGPGSISTASATTNQDGEATVTYTAPDPIADDRTRVVGRLTDRGGETFDDSVGIRLEHLPIEVTIDPRSAKLLPGEIRGFTATVTNTGNTAVTWSATGGSVDRHGSYTAGQQEGQFSVTATSVADPSKSAAAAVLIGGSVFGWYQGTFTFYDGPTCEITWVYGQNAPARLIPDGPGALLGFPTGCFDAGCFYRIASLAPGGGAFSGYQSECKYGDAYPNHTITGSVGGGKLDFEIHIPDPEIPTLGRGSLTKCDDPDTPVCGPAP